MAFKSLIILALVASAGRIVAAPLTVRHLDSRNPCQGIWCGIIGDGHPDLSRRLAQFNDPNVTLSSGTPGIPTPVDPPATPVNPSSTTSSIDLPSTLPVDPYPALPVDPSSSTNPADDTNIPPATEPAAGDILTVTVISTVFLSPTNPAASLPTQFPGSVFSPIPYPVSGDPYSSIDPEGGIISTPSVSEPTGISTSLSLPAPSVSPPSVLEPPAVTPSPTIIELSDGIPGSSVSSPAVGQPTPPAPTPTGGIVFLPPSGEDVVEPDLRRD